jgi:hypothetical protein
MLDSMNNPKIVKELTTVSQDEFEDLVFGSTTDRLQEALRDLRKVKGTKWELKFIKDELKDRKLDLGCSI